MKQWEASWSEVAQIDHVYEHLMPTMYSGTLFLIRWSRSMWCEIGLQRLAAAEVCNHATCSSIILYGDKKLPVWGTNDIESVL